MLGPGPPADVEVRSIETMGILLKAGANVNARVTETSSLTARIARSSTMTNREGQTVLFFDTQSGRAAVVRFLLEHGATVDAMGDSGEALLNAARNHASEPQPMCVCFALHNWLISWHRSALPGEFAHTRL